MNYLYSKKKILGYTNPLAINIILIIIIIITTIYLTTTTSNITVNKAFTNNNLINYNYTILIDKIGMLFVILVRIVTTNVINYSAYYISKDIYKNRFILILFLFILSIIILAVSQNLLIALVGWDGLGITSYILVNYYQNTKSTSSATITIVINRLGDASLVIAIAIIIPSKYIDILNFMTPPSIILIIAAIVKRAQFPFRSWLPAAIAAPTPVSSLVHSSTLVTAGLFLIIRHTELIIEQIYKWLIIIGVTTILFSSHSAYSESNIKKIIALSTLRQLGLIFLFLGCKQINITMFHLTIHAFFKSILFILAGTFLHNLQGNLDTRYIISNYTSYYLILVSAVIGNLALIGVPYYSGFFSKDLTIEVSISQIINNYITLSIILSIFITITYSYKIILTIRTNTNTQFVINKLRLKEIQITVIIIPCITYTIYGAWLYITSVTDNYIKSVILFTNKFYILIIIVTSIVLLSIFWSKINKKFKKISYNSYFIKTSLANIRQLTNKVKYFIITNEKNLLDLILGRKAKLIIMNIVLIVCTNNNYIKALFIIIIALLFSR